MITVRRFGSSAVLVEHEQPLLFAEAIRRRNDLDFLDLVVGEMSVLVRFAPGVDPVGKITMLEGLVIEPQANSSFPTVEIPVRFDGEDLEEVASSVGLRPTEIAQMISQAEFRAVFCGFVPGFAYLGGLPEVLHLPRRSTPRRVVPAGSLAIAAGYAGLYPQATPGGWHLIGSTSAKVWDIQRRPPALITPGTVVRFLPQGVI
jgi:KipI family sensor histidine kinase inhibitor